MLLLLKILLYYRIPALLTPLLAAERGFRGDGIYPFSCDRKQSFYEFLYSNAVEKGIVVIFAEMRMHTYMQFCIEFILQYGSNVG